MTVAGDTQEVGEGDLVLVPPATDHSIANTDSADLCCVSVQSPAVTASEVFGRSGVGVASEYDEE
jgi:mannose-6-phosphate isomerase-like protein (cupin superfamily)